MKNKSDFPYKSCSKVKIGVIVLLASLASLPKTLKTVVSARRIVITQCTCATTNKQEMTQLKALKASPKKSGVSQN
jgi:hypothetical protein